MKKERNKIQVGKSSVAIAQIILLVVSIVAFSYMIGSEFRIVSADSQCPSGSSWICKDKNRDGSCKTYECKYDLTSDSGACGGTAICKDRNYISKGISCPAWECVLTSDSTGGNSGPQPPAPTTPANRITNTAERIVTGAAGSVVERAAEEALKKTPTPNVPGKSIFNKLGLDKLGFDKLGAPGRAIGKYTGIGFKAITHNLIPAALIYAGTSLALRIFGVNNELADSIALAASLGYLGYEAGFAIAKAAGAGAAAGPIGAFVAAVIAAAIVAFTGETQRINVVTFSCNPWSAPVGGEDCEKCNVGDYPCTEYKCQSLGQACELENKGTKEEICVWKNRTDVRPPEIRPWVQILTTGYNYNPDNAISLPNRGVKIIPGTNLSGCIAPWTPITFGVTLDKPGKCKVDVRDKNNYSAMSLFFGGSSTTKYNHSMVLPPFPSNESLSASNGTIQNGGKITIYTRCQSVNGNSNVENFIFNFCVDQGPDRTPPRIMNTNIPSGSPISFGKGSAAIQVYVNEPSDCKWSRLDKSYDDMETQMSCAKSASEFNAQMLYSCSTILDGLKDRQDNEFYFRCKDQPHLEGTNRSFERNTNLQSYKFVLKGTQPLVIDSAGPNNTVVRDSTSSIKVVLTAKTSAGFKSGEATCSYKDMAVASSSTVDFFKTGSFNHSQEIWLPTGNYTYRIECRDAGNNADNRTINFRVETDTKAPTVARVFRQSNQLKVITNEEARCVYDSKGCDYVFEDGINMSRTLNGTEHSAAWDVNKVFYIKCADRYGNQPLPNQCNIVAKPYEMK